jgi:hypothetical protein
MAGFSLLSHEGLTNGDGRRMFDEQSVSPEYME